jgi:hypothetical protein
LNRVDKSVKSVRINKVLDIIYATVVCELYILFWLVLLFKELCLRGREVKDTVRYINRSKLCLYIKKDYIDYSNGYGA